MSTTYVASVLWGVKIERSKLYNVVEHLTPCNCPGVPADTKFCPHCGAKLRSRVNVVVVEGYDEDEKLFEFDALSCMFDDKFVYVGKKLGETESDDKEPSSSFRLPEVPYGNEWCDKLGTVLVKLGIEPTIDDFRFHVLLRTY